MRYLGDGSPVYTATDLCDYLACAHLVALKRRVAAGESIPSNRSALSEVLANLGARHEERHLEALRATLSRSVFSFLLAQLRVAAFRSSDPKKAFFVDFGDAMPGGSGANGIFERTRTVPFRSEVSTIRTTSRPGREFGPKAVRTSMTPNAVP